VSGPDDVSECLAGNGHFLGGVFLVKAFQVGEADRLKFINRQADFLKI